VEVTWGTWSLPGIEGGYSGRVALSLSGRIPSVLTFGRNGVKYTEGPGYRIVKFLKNQ
jgi:hypothetical protein